MRVMSDVVCKRLILQGGEPRRVDRAHHNGRRRRPRCCGAAGAPFRLSLVRFRGNAEKSGRPVLVHVRVHFQADQSGFFRSVFRKTLKKVRAAAGSRRGSTRGPEWREFAAGCSSQGAAPRAPPRPPRRLARVEPAREFEPFVAAGAGAPGGGTRATFGRGDGHEAGSQSGRLVRLGSTRRPPKGFGAQVFVNVHGRLVDAPRHVAPSRPRGSSLCESREACGCGSERRLTAARARRLAGPDGRRVRNLAMGFGV